MSEVQRYEEAKDAWTEAHPGPGATAAELASHPDRVHWRATHDECEPDPEPYFIAVENLRTPWGLVEWTAHLMEKTWLEYTDWDALLREKHTQAGSAATP